MNDLEKMQYAYQNIESLAYEVANGLFIPKRFRKAPFTEALKVQYVRYLSNELTNLGSRIRAAMGQAGPKPLVITVH